MGVVAIVKSKLFTMATTAKIEFQIKKPIVPHKTYGINCSVDKEHVANLSYDVSGVLFDPNNEKDVYASCVAKMANPFALPPTPNAPPAAPIS